jgi:hypothetical protein
MSRECLPNIGSYRILALGLWIIASIARADSIDPSENFANFGKQVNLTCPVSPLGVCAAASAINSFIFLQNQYPAIYGTKLAPNVQADQTDPMDTLAFANLYYPLTGDSSLNYLLSKQTWINSRAPGTTVFDSFFAGSPNHNGEPTTAFLLAEEAQQEDVELFVRDVTNPGVAHAIVLTGISCTPENGCVITTQDPNSPTAQQTQQVFFGLTGGLEIVGLPGTGSPYLTDIFEIYAAFSESPVPEPRTWLLLSIAIPILFRLRRRCRCA